MPSHSRNDQTTQDPGTGAVRDPGRRSFLKLGAGVTAASAATYGVAQGLESPEAQVDARYSRTPHVERYYFLNRL